MQESQFVPSLNIPRKLLAITRVNITFPFPIVALSKCNVMPPIYLIHPSTRSNDVVNLNWKRCSGVNLIKVKSLLKLHLFSFHLFVSFTTSRVNYFRSYFHCHLNLIHTFHEKHRICTHLRMKIILDTCKKIALGKLSFFHFQTKLVEFFHQIYNFLFLSLWMPRLMKVIVGPPVRWMSSPEAAMVLPSRVSDDNLASSTCCLPVLYPPLAPWRPLCIAISLSLLRWALTGWWVWMWSERAGWLSCAHTKSHTRTITTSFILSCRSFVVFIPGHGDLMLWKIWRLAWGLVDSGKYCREWLGA